MSLLIFFHGENIYTVYLKLAEKRYEPVINLSLFSYLRGENHTVRLEMKHPEGLIKKKADRIHRLIKGKQNRSV